MELQNAAVEDQVFMNVPITREDRPEGEPEDPQYEPNNYVSFVEGAGRPVGHAKALMVNEGESIDLKTDYYFEEGNTTNYSANPINDILTHLAYIFVLNNPANVGLPSEQVNQMAQQMILNNNEVNNFVTNMFTSTNIDPMAPRAFMVYMMLDNDFRIVPEASGALQADNPETLDYLAVASLQIPRGGYLYVYVNNASIRPVFFDNLYISQTSSKLLDESNYYPFGMLWNVPNTDNKYKYNGKELQKDLGLFTEDYGARFYDPTLARWFAIDPKSDSYFANTNYGYVNNNPLIFIDPDGKTTTYLDFDGNVLYQSTDNLPPSVVAIAYEKIDYFNEQLNSGVNPNTDEFNKNMKSQMGIKYNIDEIVDSYSGLMNDPVTEAKSDDEIPVDGQGPLFFEYYSKGLFIGDNQNGTIGVTIPEKGDGPGSNPGGSMLFSPYQIKIHYHPNEGRLTKGGRFAKGKEAINGFKDDLGRWIEADAKNGGKAGTGFFDIILTRDAVEFYNRSGLIFSCPITKKEETN
jgi:RHS repeat-associated protein